MSEPATIADLIRRRADEHRPALWFEGRWWTWQQVAEAMHARAHLLADLAPNDPPHVGVLLDNVPEFLFLLGGAALSGRVLVGLNDTRRGSELAHDIRHTDCRVVITDQDHSRLLDGLALGAAVDRVVLVDSRSYEASLLQAADVPVVEPAPSDLLLLLFTSGSSGAPKAVRVTNRRAFERSQGMAFRPNDVLYCAMPLFHGNALMSTIFPALGFGPSIVLKRRFSASEFIGDVREHGCTFFSTIGRALAYILATPEAPDDAENELKVVLAPESSAVDRDRFEKRFGTWVVSGYGSSENAIMLTPHPDIPDALGLPFEGQDVAIIDPETVEECPRARFDGDGKLLNPGEAIGEIVGRNVLGNFEGYYKNDDAAAERSRHGWYWSGDLGYRDEEGVFYFAGRTADWLRVDGENFAAAPVERVLERFESVSGVAVYGVPDEQTVDDQVMAALELARGAEFDPAAFDAFLAEQRDLGTKGAPRYVRLVPQLPVGATTKVVKTSLRRERWAVDDPVFWRPDRRGPLVRMSAGDVDELHARFEVYGRAAALAADV
jgi:fatty-acyl-CoA synthase